MSASALIRQARAAAGLTQAELGARLGVSQPVIARLESATSNPTYATLERALRATGHGLALAGRPAPATATATVAAGEPLDLAVPSLVAAVAALGEITGAEATEAILSGIFARFCVGK